MSQESEPRRESSLALCASEIWSGAKGRLGTSWSGVDLDGMKYACVAVVGKLERDWLCPRSDPLSPLFISCLKILGANRQGGAYAFTRILAL